MMVFMLYLLKIVRGLTEAATLILTIAELYKLYKSWLESGQASPQRLRALDLEAAA